MDEFNDNEITKLLRLKRYEQPPPRYFENFLHEFHRRQRDELLRQNTFLNLSREAVDMATIKARSLYWGHGAGTRVLSFEQKREFVRTMIGQPVDRAGAQGVFVTMVRAPNGSKKNVS